MSKPLIIIPARAGSKSIPNKNFKLLAGVSCVQRALDVAYAIDAAPIVLTSDYALMGDDQLVLGPHPKRAWIPPFIGLYRPAELAQDDTPMIDVVRHVLEQIPGPPDQPILICQPTQPLREPKHLRQALELLTPEVDSVVSVVELPLTHSPELALFIAGDQLYPAMSQRGWWQRPATRQEAREGYIPDGTCYAFWRQTVVDYQTIYGERVVPLIIPPNETCALDTPLDWAEAERRLRARTP